MFTQACRSNREAIYGLLACSPAPPQGMTASNGSAFMIAPGFLITAAHCAHVQTDPAQPLHQKFEVIRAPEVGQAMETAALLAVDDRLDLALLRIATPRSCAALRLLAAQVSIGTAVGSLGFPLAQVAFTPQGVRFNLVERFQGANISALGTAQDPQGNPVVFYETDSLMYGGSSGCPGFVAEGAVFGMHNRSVIDPGRGGPPPQDTQVPGIRLAISLWVPSSEILAFARRNGVPLDAPAA